MDDLTGTFYAAFGPETNPTEYTSEFQITGPTSSDIVSSIATDQSSYLPGQPVNLTFTETNEGSQPILIVVSDLAFQIKMSGAIVWESGAGLSGLSWSQLDPGQTYTQTQTWNGTGIDGKQLVGQFVVTNFLDATGPIASFSIVNPDPIGSGPVTGLSTSPSDGTSSTTNDPVTGVGNTNTGSGSTGLPIAPNTVSTVATDKSAYKVGQSVHIALVVQKRVPVKGAVPSLRPRELITVMEGSTVIWQATRRIPSVQRNRVSTGESATFTTVWNGKSNQAGIRKLSPGSYSVEITDSEYGGQTSFTIGRKGS